MDTSFSFSDPSGGDTSLGSFDNGWGFGGDMAAAGVEAGGGLGGLNSFSDYGGGDFGGSDGGGYFSGNGFSGSPTMGSGDPNMGPPAPPAGGDSPWYDNPYFRLGLRFLAKGNPLVNGLMTLYDMSRTKGKSFAGQVGGTLGSQLGSSLGPVGAMAGGMLGAQGLPGIAGPVGGRPDQNAGTTPPPQSSGSNNQGMNWGRAGQDLLGLYGNYKMGKSAQSNIDQLRGLYAPGSPYAQQMAQGMQRRDAAAGRRSQYGSREVELAAKLADMQSRNAPAIAQQQQQADLAKMRNLQLLYNFGTEAWKGAPGDFVRDSTWWG